MYRTLSWGGGTQSTAIGEMSACGDLPKLDAILFADTQFERKETIEIVEFYTRRWRKMGLHVETVSAGNIEKRGAEAHIHIPFRTASGAPLQRQCTHHFKIDPVKKRVRELLGYHASKPPHPPASAVEQWIGFSWDEFYRMSTSRVKFMVNRYPLIELKMNRWDSISYLENKGLPVPVASACVCCPFRSSSEWLEMKKNSPSDFERAIAFDDFHRSNTLAKSDSVSSAELFIYKNAIPLSGADLLADAKRERNEKQIPLMVCNDGQCWT